jgi:hypothetical protein
MTAEDVRRRSNARAEAPISGSVIRSVEPIDLSEFLLAYARAILEVKGSGPLRSPSTSTTTRPE